MAAGTKNSIKQKTSRQGRRQTAPQATSSLDAAATLAARVNRAELGQRTRLHAVAKLIGLPTKEVVVLLAARGVTKVAQSSLEKSEVEAFLDALIAEHGGSAQSADAATDHAHPVDEAHATDHAHPVDEAPAADHAKLEQWVRKNVENEFHQIKDKVDAELAQQATVAEEAGDFADYYPPFITPIPAADATATSEYAPLFLAPEFPAPACADEGTAGDTDSDLNSDASGDTAGDADRRQRERIGGRDEERGAGAVVERIDQPKAVVGSTRIEAQRRRRQELREQGRERHNLVSQAEFLARRESLERTMIVCEKARSTGQGTVTQVGVLEDDQLVEHFVTSESQSSMIGNIYLGRVQNVLPSMEAAFIDIGQGRNGVLYAGEVDWRQAGLGGRSRRIEHALKSGDQVLVQVSKDPVGHKGARLTTQISLAGRYLVYVPGGRTAGISRKLPVPERKRLKHILERVVPAGGGTIIRTAAEKVPEEAIAADVRRLHSRWEEISRHADQEKRSRGAKPVTLYEEPDLLVKVIRDLFNEDFSRLIVDGERSFQTINHYLESVAPDLADRVERYERQEHDGVDAFQTFRIDEQLQKALSRKVWLPSGGTLVIDHTEAMTVIDVNTGKFTGSSGNLEQTVTRNNLEAAEEIVRQMRLRDLGGMIVVDFIDMVLPENQDLVLRRLKEALGRDRTRHQVSEVTSLGLVQMTRKRLGSGLLETFSSECTQCQGRGLVVHEHPQAEAPRVEPPRDSIEEPPRPVVEESPRPAVKERPSFEDLADSVLGLDVEATERSPKRRRGVRGSSRGRAQRDEQPIVSSDTSEIEAIAYAAVDNAVARDVAETVPEAGREGARRRVRRRATSRVTSSNVETPAVAPSREQDYAQALAEFEASPRRKRRTRGNSVSDHRPRPEDFGITAQLHADAPATGRADGRAAARAAQSIDAAASNPAGRRRRRVVRRSF